MYNNQFYIFLFPLLKREMEDSLNLIGISRGFEDLGFHLQTYMNHSIKYKMSLLVWVSSHCTKMCREMYTNNKRGRNISRTYE